MPTLLIVIIACAAVFWPVLSAGFLSLDDPQHILLNPGVITGLPASLYNIFSQSINKIYLPLTTLSFAIEKQFTGFNPFVMHLNNLLLHIATAVSAYFLLKRLGVNARAAALSILIFAIHPMKVESVAWLTERKDVLYALFYVWTLLAYVRFIQHNSLGHYALAVVLCLLSLLSKPMALSLPFILLLLDWYLRRKITLLTLFEKLPFAVIAGGIGWITYAQNMRNPISDTASAALIWIWSCMFYIWKFLCPVNVYAYYKLPQPVVIFSWEYGGSVVLMLLILCALWLWRRRRLFVLAAGFYFFSIFFLLRFDVGVDASIVNDRFMYLPGLGFCVLLGLLAFKLCRSRIGRVVTAVVLILLGVKTNQQCLVWKDTLSFYNEVIRAYPDAFTGYYNRAHYFYEHGNLEQALADYDSAITLAPDFAPNYIGRGTILGQLKDHANAVRDFSQAISLNPTLMEGYFNRSISEYGLGLYAQAYTDALHALKMGVPVPEAFLNELRLKAEPPSP